LIKKYEHEVVPNNLKIFLKFAELTEEEFLKNIEHLRDTTIWEKKSDGTWNLIDWIGNHISDEGIEEVRLPIKEKWYSLKSKKYTSPREYSQPDNDEDMVFI